MIFLCNGSLELIEKSFVGMSVVSLSRTTAWWEWSPTGLHRSRVETMMKMLKNEKAVSVH